MKNYQKPMVNIEMINVEDVITTSVSGGDSITSDFGQTTNTAFSALGGSSEAKSDATIVFEW